MSPRHSLLLLLGVLLSLLLLALGAPTSALVLRTPGAAIANGADSGLPHDPLGHRHIHRQRQRQSLIHLRKPVSRSDGAAPLILPRDLDLSPTLAADSPAISSSSSSPTIATTSPTPSIKPRKSRRSTTPPSTQKRKRQADVAGAIDDLSKRTIIIIAGTIGGIIVALILMCVIRDKQGKEPCPCGAMPIDCCPTF